MAVMLGPALSVGGQHDGVAADDDAVMDGMFLAGLNDGVGLLAVVVMQEAVAAVVA